jgi:SAM-dependent methyltransferase
MSFATGHADATSQLTALLEAYYTRYYRDVLGLPDWRVKVSGRLCEEDVETERIHTVAEALGRPLGGLRVLNVGCGTGGFNVAAGRAGARTWGIDAEPDAIRICELKRAVAPGGHYAVAAAEALPFRDASFDLVYCLSTLEHVADPGAALREMMRVLHPTGALMVYAPNSWAPYENHYKLLWPPLALCPRPLLRVYLRLRRRPPGFVDTLNRLSFRLCRRLLRRAGAVSIEPFGLASLDGLGTGRRARVLRFYYEAFRIRPAIQLIARKVATARP